MFDQLKSPLLLGQQALNHAAQGAEIALGLGARSLEAHTTLGKELVAQGRGGFAAAKAAGFGPELLQTQTEQLQALSQSLREHAERLGEIGTDAGNQTLAWLQSGASLVGAETEAA